MVEQRPNIELHLGKREPFTTFNPDLSEFVEVYRSYVATLTPEEDDIRMNFGYGLLKETQVLTHMEARDQIGLDWTAIILEGTFGMLDDDQKIQAKQNPNILLESAIKTFRGDNYTSKNSKTYLKPGFFLLAEVI